MFRSGGYAGLIGHQNQPIMDEHIGIGEESISMGVGVDIGVEIGPRGRREYVRENKRGQTIPRPVFLTAGTDSALPILSPL